MPDIEMCNSEKCHKKEKCFRYKATPSFRQYFSDFYEEGKKCVYFITNK